MSIDLAAVTNNATRADLARIRAAFDSDFSELVDHVTRAEAWNANATSQGRAYREQEESIYSPITEALENGGRPPGRQQAKEHLGAVQRRIHDFAGTYTKRKMRDLTPTLNCLTELEGRAKVNDPKPVRIEMMGGHPVARRGANETALMAKAQLGVDTE